MFAYGKMSNKKIATLEHLMQEVCHRAMAKMNARKSRRVDFGISHALRSDAEQNALYQIGRTKPGKIVTHADGYKEKSVHQFGFAVDFYAYVDGKASYDHALLALIAMCFAEAATELGLRWRWGGNFTTIADAGHFECYQ